MVDHPSVLDALLLSLGGLVRRLTEQTGDLVPALRRHADA